MSSTFHKTFETPGLNPVWTVGRYTLKVSRGVVKDRVGSASSPLALRTQLESRYQSSLEHIPEPVIPCSPGQEAVLLHMRVSRKAPLQSVP